MRSLKKAWRIIIITALFALLVFFSPNLGRIIISNRFFLNSLIDRSFSYEEYLKVVRENTVLREEIKKKSGERNLPLSEEKFKYKEIEVYSQYPFNDKNVLIINLGSLDGVTVGMPVVSEHIVIGNIEEVKNTQSKIRTVFDNRWTNSVYVGGKGVRGLFKGGLVPSLEFVPTDALVAPGDLVYNSSPNLPFGFVMGAVEKTEKGDGRFWSRVTVKPLFNFDELRKVLILLNFP